MTPLLYPLALVLWLLAARHHFLLGEFMESLKEGEK